MTETFFTNPHGLDDPEERTSAADLLKLTKAVLGFPAFGEIVAQDSAYVAGRSLVNTNHLLSLYPGADGLKTGTTAAAGECLVASVTREGHRLLVILLGSQDRYADAAALLDYAAATWRWQPLALPADALAWAIGADGRSYRLRTAEKAELFLPTWQWQLVQPVRMLDPAVPLTATVPVGTLTLMSGAQVLSTVPLTVWQSP
jgi:D-alanyl-D-alanine carboxypeptidase